MADLTDATNLIRIVQETQPDEIYNLAAQSHVQVSFETAEYTANSDCTRNASSVGSFAYPENDGPHAFLSGIHVGTVWQSAGDPQTEKTPFYPRSPYAVAKLYAY